MKKRKKQLSTEEILVVGKKISLNKLIRITPDIRIMVLSSFYDPEYKKQYSQYKGHYFTIDKTEMLKGLQALWFLHKKKRWVKVTSTNSLFKPNDRGIHVEIIGDKKPKPKKKHKPLKKKKDAKSKNIHSKSLRKKRSS